ncbi:hypothetical protein ACRALDRAFT_2025891 [Sodiomyces alcalophilus JCM 7366]|uniref:uncharacterized protein n=1 Tax=Sodiomyces alcalophilus JCM 7366 TaxID=591952 RepID=UPI0039B50F2E
MQNWHSNEQPASGPGEGQSAIWSSTYPFNDGTGQFDGHQTFPQEGNQVSLPGQAVYGSGQVNGRTASAESGLFGSTQRGQAGISDRSSLPAVTHDSGFYSGTDPNASLSHGHARYSVNETYSQPGQEQPLQGLRSIAPKVYGNPVTLPQSHGPAFSQTPYQYQAQHASPYGSQPGQYTGAQLASQQPPQQSTHQQMQLGSQQPPQAQSHQPQQHPQQYSLYQQPQRFDAIRRSFSSSHTFPQQHQQQQQQQQVKQTQQAQQHQQPLQPLQPQQSQQTQQHQQPQQAQQHQQPLQPLQPQQSQQTQQTQQHQQPQQALQHHQPLQPQQSQPPQQTQQNQQTQQTQQHQQPQQAQQHHQPLQPLQPQQSQQPQQPQQPQQHHQPLQPLQPQQSQQPLQPLQSHQPEQQRVQQQASLQHPQQHLPATQSPPTFASSAQPYHGQAAAGQPVGPRNVQAYAYHQPSAAGHLQGQTNLVPQQMMYRQPASPAAFQPSPMRQSIEQEVQQQPHQQPRQQTSSAASHLIARPADQQSMAATSSPGPGSGDGNTAAIQAEHPAKKRKTLAKKEDDSESVTSQRDHTPTTLPSGGATTWTPTSTEAELASLAQFKKRSAAAKKSFPPITGAPYLVCTGTVKLPTPRSYDRLAPMVALPSQSGRPIMPDLGYPLPCEIQGKFADRYKPSANFVGKPEDREMEAKALIDEYQQAMKGLGHRRPKYADYPFAFQEQLKADEAAKSKAQRKARKEEEEERRRPIRPEVRPSDPIEATAWDILGIVYIDPAATRTNSLIASAVQSLGEFFIKMRGEMSKLKQEIDQGVKEKRAEGEVQKLKKEYELKKDMVARGCEAAHKHGDEAVLENLGGHQKGVLSLINLLIGCIKAADYSGKLPKAVLRFMTNISLTKRIADGVNFETVRKRFADKGDDEVKGLIRSVASRIRKETEASSSVEGKKSLSIPASATSTTTSSAASSSAATAAAAGRTANAKVVSTTKPGNGTTSTKRPHDDEPDTRPGKKANIDGTSSSLSSKFGSHRASAGTTLQSKLSAPKIRPPSTSLAAKNRPLVRAGAGSDTAKTTEPAKPDGSAVSTAMDIDARPSPRPEPKKAKAETAKPAAAPKASGPSPGPSSGSLSSIGSLLDSINMPKADSQASQKSPGKTDTTETPEERAKRLRKEARRKLRVTWKPEAELVQVRIFHKEAAEDEDNMTQDAADDRSEGMMLKRRSELTDEDDDEDDLEDRPWVEPVATDLSRIPKNYRAKSFVTRGGTLTFQTDEQRAIAEREQKELMAVYALVSDIPPTPKSPPPEPSVPDGEAKDVHLPRDGEKYGEIRQRWQEYQRHGIDAAMYYAIKRLKDQDDPAVRLQSLLSGFKTTPATEPVQEGYNYNMTPPQQHAQPVIFGDSGRIKPPGPSDVSFGEQVLSLLSGDRVGKWRDPEPYNSSAPRTHRRHDYGEPGLQGIINALEDIFEQLKGLPYPATQPPAWLANDQERVREWWAGYQKDATARAKKEAENRARAEAAKKVQQAAALFAPPQQDASQGQSVQANQDAWTAYYQQLHLQQQQQQQQQDQYAQYMALLQQTQGGHAQQPTTQAAASLLGAQSGQLGDAQLQALLSQINQPQQSQVAAAGQNSSSGGDRATSYYGREWSDKQDNGYDYGSERDRDGDYWDRRDSRERDEWRDKHAGGAGAKGGRKGNAPGGPTLPPHRPANKALIGTKPCVFWQQGKCARGDKCTFRHDD